MSSEKTLTKNHSFNTEAIPFNNTASVNTNPKYIGSAAAYCAGIGVKLIPGTKKEVKKASVVYAERTNDAQFSIFFIFYLLASACLSISFFLEIAKLFGSSLYAAIISSAKLSSILFLLLNDLS